MIKEAIEKARAYSDNKDKIDAYYDGYVACYLELNKQIEKMKCCYNCQRDCGSIDRRICVENNLKDWQQRR